MIRQDGDNVPTQAYGPRLYGDLAPRPGPAAPAGAAGAGVRQRAPLPPGGPTSAGRAGGRTAERAERGSAWWSATQEIPLPWEARALIRQRRPGTFRLPAPDDPAPATGRMLGVCAWAALLGVVGLAVAGRAMVAMLAGSAPGWYEPTVLTCGVVGIGLTAAAFLAVHQPRLPWGLLATASVPLAVNLVGTAAAF